jgi:hypothetical protein
MIGCIAKLQEEIRRTNRKVQHEPLDESKAFNNYTIITIFWWMNIHLPVNLMFTKDAFDTSPCHPHVLAEVPGERAPTGKCREAYIEDGCRTGISRFTAR